MTHRVAIVEDHRLLAEVLRASLSAEGIEACILELQEIAALVETIRAARPDLVLLDLDLGHFGDSVPAIAPLVEAGIRVIVVSGTSDIARIVNALDAGATAFCEKTVGFEELAARIVTALRSDGPLDGTLRRRLASELALRDAERRTAWEPFERLTEREQTTLRELSRGLSVRDIARSWVVSEATVRTHVRGVLTKLEVPSQLAAVAAALEANWLARAS